MCWHTTTVSCLWIPLLNTVFQYIYIYPLFFVWIIHFVRYISSDVFLSNSFNHLTQPSQPSQKESMEFNLPLKPCQALILWCLPPRTSSCEKGTSPTTTTTTTKMILFDTILFHFFHNLTNIVLFFFFFFHCHFKKRSLSSFCSFFFLRSFG